jgi:subtilase family serine protease
VTKIGPDLIESSTVVPGVSGAGMSLIVSETVKNQGSDVAGASTTSFYLSTNLWLDANDVFLGSRSVPALAVGATSTASTVLLIPAGTATNILYVLVQADANNDVAESTESNNISYGWTWVGPDLSVAGLTLPASAVAGTTISTADTVRNSGGGAAAATTTRFYLSTNFSFDSADVLIGTRVVPALDPGTTNAGTESLTIPAQTAAGLYYIIAVADGDGVVTETAENNNTRGASIRITSGS